MGYVKMVPAEANRHENWTSEFVLERDEETGEPTKVVKAGVPVDLSKEEQDKLATYGVTFEESSAEEAKEYEESATTNPAGADIVGAAPSIESTASGTDQPKGGSKSAPKNE